MTFLLFDKIDARYSDGLYTENPTQLSNRNWRFYQRMELANTSENATTATGRTAPDYTCRSKKGTTVRKEEGTKEGRSISSRVLESHKGTTVRDGELEARREGKLSSMYCSVKKL